MRCLSALVIALAACATPAGEGVSVQATFLTGGLPEGVVAVQALVLDGDGRALRRGTPVPLSALGDADGNGRRELLVGGLPTDRVVEVQLEALGSDGDRDVRAVGRSGPLRLGLGERRVVRVALYEVGLAQPVPSAGPGPRFLHTSTALADGRVLVTGGFIDAAPSPCPPGTATDALCFQLRGARDGWLYEPATARWREVTPGLAAARGAHSATRLGDGRVLVAGGAEEVFLVLIPEGPEGTPSGFDVSFGGTSAADPASGSYELFDPELGAEAEDRERDGDPGRGAFVGPGDGERLGELDLPRLLHAAAAVPGESGLVLLVGGASDEASLSLALFDADAEGGPALRPGGALRVARRFPSALGLTAASGPEVWIFGGVDRARSNGDLASIWRFEGAGSGVLEDAAETTLFPGDLPAPERALLAPTVFPLDGGNAASVTGWYGPRCAPGAAEEAPLFTDDERAVRCAPDGGPERAFVVRAGSGASLATLAPEAARQSFGAAAVLADGRVLVSGGIGAADFTTGLRLTLYAAETDDVGQARVELLEGANLLRARAFHRMTAVSASSVLSTGGVQLALSGSTPELSLVGLAEVFTLPPPELVDAPGTGGNRDAGAPDAPGFDAGLADAAVTDAAVTDAAVTDAAVTDAAVTDAGP